MKRENERARILVVDDEENLRHMLQVLLRKQGYLVDAAADGAQALRLARERTYDFTLCDIKMPAMDGPSFLRAAVAADVGGTIIMMSAYGTIETAVECMKLGAYDYISKPFKNDEIVLVLKKAEERERLKSENRRLQEEVQREFSFDNIISRDERMQEVFSLIRRVSGFKTTVLILGESGTGKELVARAIHYNSGRRLAPFVAVNCGAIPETLLESELFGHAKGAFTDAVADKAGLFEQADGGTLFLDEVGEMPLPLPVKLLRVLQEEEIRRLGEAASRKVDVRVISATSKDLEQEIVAGRFREDLYFRLNVFTISLPPLRARAADIPLLVDHFLEKQGARGGCGAPPPPAGQSLYQACRGDHRAGTGAPRPGTDRREPDPGGQAPGDQPAGTHLQDQGVRAGVVSGGRAPKCKLGMQNFHGCLPAQATFSGNSL